MVHDTSGDLVGAGSEIVCSAVHTESPGTLRKVTASVQMTNEPIPE